MKSGMEGLRGSVGASAEVGGVMGPESRAWTGVRVDDEGGAASYHVKTNEMNRVSELGQ